MSDLERSYYEQSELWAGGHGDSGSVLHGIGLLMPDDVGSILDVGCGDGAITNRLAVGDRRVVGGDFSLAALAHVQTPRVGLSADALPFADNSFDLVMSTDMIEHLPDGVVEQAIAEMVRVAARYVLVCVPQREPAAHFGTRCLQCGHEYHVNHHQRGYTIEDFAAITGVAVRASVSVGTRWTHPDNDLASAERSVTRRGFHFPYAMCPECGATGATNSSDVQSVAERRFEALQYLRCEAGEEPRPCRSELIVLLDRRDRTQPMPPHDDGRGTFGEAERVRIERSSRPPTTVLETFPTTWSWLSDGAATIVVTPRAPRRVRADAGASIEVYDFVSDAYVAAENVDDDGAAELPRVRPDARGYRLRIDGAPDVIDVEFWSPLAAGDAAIELAFGYDPPRPDERSAQQLAEVAARATEYYELTQQFAGERAHLNDLLNEEAARAEANAARVAELYEQVQQLADERARLNELLNELAAVTQSAQDVPEATAATDQPEATEAADLPGTTQ